MTKPLIFICSPFGGMFHNMRHAAALAEKVFKAGGIPYIPHLQFPWFMDESPESRKLSLEMSTAVLYSKCDALYYEDLPTSGMDEELEKIQKVKPIFNDIGDVKTFCHTFSKMEESHG